MAGIVAAVGLGITAAASIGQMVSGAVKTSRAKKALQNYQRQELKTVTDDLRVSTLGAELQAREASRRFSTSVDALQASGVRGVVGGLSRVEAGQQRVNQSIAADLDRQQAQIEKMRAMDRQRIQGMVEQRESQDIAGLGSQMGAGQQQVQAGMGGLMQAGVSAADAASQGAFDGLFKQ